MRSIRPSATRAGSRTRRGRPPPARYGSSWTDRSRSTSTRRRTCPMPRRPSARSVADRQPSRLEVVALEGIPEITPGDALAARIVAALEWTDGVLPLRDDDALVVTQKVVSKAEGAIVDLTTIEPRADAVEFARRWDRDARQV